MNFLLHQIKRLFDPFRVRLKYIETLTSKLLLIKYTYFFISSGNSSDDFAALCISFFQPVKAL